MRFGLFVCVARFLFSVGFRSRCVWFSLLFSCFFVSASSLINPGPLVEVLTTVNGERLTDVRALVQGRSGFIWMATNQGLLRYDGSQLKRFSVDENSQNSLSDNDVRNLVVDEDGIIWLITRGGGLNRFDPKTEVFSRFTHDNEQADSLDSNRLNTIALGANGKLWIGSDVGINLFDRQTLKNKRFNSLLQQDGVDQAEDIQTIFEDSQQRLWYSVRRQGLYLHIPQTDRTLHFARSEGNTNQSNSLDSNAISEIYQSPNGDIWIGTALSINRFSPDTLDFTRFVIPLKSRNKVKHASVTSIYQDLQGDLWVGTFYNGVSVLKAGSDQLVNINHGGNIDNSLNSMQFNDIYQDSQGVLWFVTPRRGLFKLSAKSMLFDHQLMIMQPAQSIDVLHTDKLGRLWMASGSQIFVYQHIKQQFSLLLDLKNLADLPITSEETVKNLRVLSIFCHDEQNIVIKIDSLGIFLVNLETQVLRQVLLPEGLNADNIGLTMLGENGVLWVAGLSSGLWRLDLTVGLNDTQLDFAVVSQSVVVRELTVTVDGIAFVDDENRVYRVKNDDVGASSFSRLPTDIVINQLFEDHQNQFWLATDGHGLALWQANHQRWQFFDNDDGLPTSRVLSIVEDSKHQLWLANSHGISQFNPNSQSVNNFALSDGIRFSYWMKGLAAQLPLGEVVMVGRVKVGDDANEQDNLLGQYGVVRFSPAKLATLNQQDDNGKSILFTDFKLFNQSVPLRSIDSKSPLTTTINQMTELNLSYEQNWFAIAFSSDNFQQSQVPQYAYMLEGLSDQWIRVSADNNVASFTSVGPGDYLFKVKVIGDNSHDAMRVLPIVVTPPWWRTIWAYALYLSVIILFFISINVLRTRQLRLRAAELELGIAERTEQLKQRADTISLLLKEKEGLLEDKDRLIANISHEFRTPLTLILGPIEQQLAKLSNAESLSQLKLAQINASRLLYMVDQLLDLARLKNIDQEAKLAKNVADVCLFLVESFRPLAQARHINLKIFNKLNSDAWVKFQPDGLEKVISNLLTNAFKYSADGANVELSLRCIDERVVITVKDSGQGMSELDLKRIFKRFERLKTDEAHAPGAGIGLALVKELLELHDGNIEVHSELNVGSEFVISLPILTERQVKQLQSEQVNQGAVTEQLQYIDTSLVAVKNEKLAINHNKLEKDDEAKAKVLVIEDNQDMRQYIVSCLSDFYHCEQAVDGEQGLTMARLFLPDLVICDVMMPKMDGFAVTGALKQDVITDHIPVILLTARGDRDSRIKGWSQKADEYLEKPFNTEELLLRINNLLSIRQLLRLRFQQSFIATEAPVTKTIDDVTDDEVATAVEPTDSSVDPVHQAFLDQVNAVLLQHYSSSDFDVAQFAAEMALSHRQLGRKMKSLLDMTPAEALRYYRLSKAAELLQQGKVPSVVSHKVGFATHSYFSQCFKARYNCLPSQFCRTAQK